MGTKEVAQFQYEPVHHPGHVDHFHELFLFSGLHETPRDDDVGNRDGLCLVSGFGWPRNAAPEIKEIEKTDSEMSMILYLAQSLVP